MRFADANSLTQFYAIDEALFDVKSCPDVGYICCFGTMLFALPLSVLPQTAPRL